MINRASPAFNLDTKLVFDVLSNQFTSRLNMNLREDKGWSYGIWSYLSAYDTQSGYVFGGNVQIDKTTAALAEIQAEIQAIVEKKPITAVEIDKVINQNLLTMAGSGETNGQLLGFAATQYQAGYDDNYIHTLPDLLQATGLVQARETAKKVVQPDHIVWVLVGDLEKIEPAIRALGIAPVEILNVRGEKQPKP